MGIGTYIMCEAKVSNKKLERIAPKEWLDLKSVMDETGGTIDDIYDSYTKRYLSDLSEEEQEELYLKFKNLRKKVLRKTDKLIYPFHIDSSSEVELAGETFFAVELEFSKELQELGAELIAWSEAG